MRTLLAATAALAFLIAPAAAGDLTAGDFISPWLPVVSEVVAYVVGSIVAALFGKVGLEAGARNALQTALTNAAGQAIIQLGGKLNSVPITLGSPAIDAAVEYVLSAAPGAVRKFGLDEDALARKIIAKIGVLTAGQPTATAFSVSAPG